MGQDHIETLGSIGGSEMLMMSQSNTDNTLPVVYYLFQCGDELFQVSYMGWSGDNFPAFEETVLGSFRCGFAEGGGLQQSHAASRIPSLPQNIFHANPQTIAGDTQCHGYWDPQNNSRYDCGECTWWASYSRPDISADDRNVWNNGYAYSWDDNARNHPDLSVSSTPEVGSIAVWESNLDGAEANGHVAYVVSVNGDGTFDVTDANWGTPSYSLKTRYGIRDTDSIDFILGAVTFFERG